MISIRETFPIYETCPCGRTDRKAKFCCYISKGRWFKPPAALVSALLSTGEAHPKCWAGETRDSRLETVTIQ